MSEGAAAEIGYQGENVNEQVLASGAMTVRRTPKFFGRSSTVLRAFAKCISFLVILASPAWPQQHATDLANQSLEDLMNVQVVSASKTEESLSRAAAAIFVITQEDIRRSGATNIPDLLRMVPGADVAQIDANTRAISARGFNARFSNELFDLAALKTAHEEGRPFRLVITDMQMPEKDGFTLIQEIRKSSAFGMLPVLVLSSSGQPGEAARCRQLGVSGYLTKPAQPSELLDAILIALSKPEVIQTQSIATQDTALPSQRGKVLLVEDNAVNRKLARALLEKHGYTVVSAENGQEALEALERESVDLVLMDVQMPVMNGFEAIRAIRAKERGTGAHLPIIALTAHAMKGDRERCLAVGADDYVAKPIRTSELFAATDRVRTGTAAPSTTPPAGPSSAHVLDLDAALERVDGDRELLEELFRLFAEECPGSIAAIRRALEARDAPLLERLAQTIKGASANLGADRLSQAAFELEQGVRASLESAGNLIRKLEAEMDSLLPELGAAVRKVAP
ncbi:MAG: response regulator [Candidatus Acidiferrales bacterium]